MMKTLFLAALCFAAVAAYDMDGDVLVLHDADIDDAIKEHEFLLVEFYAPWCGHCKSLAPEYAKAATTLAALETPIRIAKVDATEETASGEKFGVQGYPTLKWFVSGEAMEFEGGRTAADIVAWVKKRTGPPCKVLATVEDVETFKASADVVVVAFVAEDSAEFKEVEKAARALSDIEVGVVYDAAVAKGLELDQPTIMVYKNFDEGSVAFKGDVASDTLLEFVKGTSLPLINTFSQATAPKLFGSGVPSHFLYFNDAEDDSHATAMESLKEVAGEFRGKTLFVFVPSSEDRVMNYFDFKEADLPAAILVSMGEGDMKKFAFKGDLTADAVKAHLSAYHSGELKPSLKSEEAPADNSGPVTTLVGTTFNDIVMDDTKDVFVKFYAPWCGHCKSLVPVWEQLGEAFADNVNMVVAKVDSTANDVDVPGLSVKGFPTLVFFPAGAKDKHETYSGAREFDDLKTWLESKAVAEKTAPAANGAGVVHEDL